MRAIIIRSTKTQIKKATVKSPSQNDSTYATHAAWNNVQL